MALSLPANGLLRTRNTRRSDEEEPRAEPAPSAASFPHFDGEHTALTRWPFGFACGFFEVDFDSQCGGGSRCVWPGDLVLCA